MIQFAYKQQDCSSVGMSSFYVLCGQECQTLTSLATSSFKIESVNQMIQEMHVLVECTKHCIQGAQERSKFYAIKKGV